MGKERISSQEIADYTNINATQIRRDLSNFGKFGKRGVGYSIDSLLSEIRKILRTQGQHNIALVGAGRLGQAITSSPIFAEHGINIAAVFDASPTVIGSDIGGIVVEDERFLKDAVRDKNIVVGVLAVPAVAAQKVADDLVDAGVRIIFNYSEALLDVPGEVTVHTSNPAVELLHALYFHLAWTPPSTRSARSTSAASPAVDGHPSRPRYCPADPALARLPARRHRVERLHARARARVEPRRPRRRRRVPGARARAVRPRRRAGRERRPSGRTAARVRDGPLRRARAEVPAGLHRRREARVRRRERGDAARAAPGRPRVHEPRADGRSGRRRERRAVPRQGARLRARVLDARPPRARALGSRGARRRRRDVRRLRAHPRGARRRRRPRRPRVRGAARRRRRRVHAPPARRGVRGADRRGAQRPAEPRQRERAPARRRQRRAPRRASSPATSRPSSTSGS